MSATQGLLLACVALVLLTFAVAARMLSMRIAEMKRERIHPQSIALSHQRSSRLQDTRASDNFNHLFEAPVLFYALCALAIANGTVPAWLVAGAWAYVLLRVAHSWIQCTSNKVMTRFKVFLASMAVLLALWLGFGISVLIG